MNLSTNPVNVHFSINLATRLFLAILIGAILVGTADQAQATGLMFYGLEDGQVRGFDIDNGDDSIVIPANAFFGSPPSPATGRNIAYDPVTDLIWYSADDNHVHSVVVSTLAAGPMISDIGDAFYGAIRTIAIDQSARRLYISNSNGNVEVYELITNTRMYTIPLAAFGLSEPNPGNRRRLAADGNGYLWFAADDGAFKEFDTFQYNPHFTGREIPVSEQIDPSNPGQQRCFVAVRWPAGEHHLYYASSDGTVRTANLDTLTNVTISFPAAWFLTSGNPGELRSLALDPTWTLPGTWPSPPTGISATDGLYPDQIWVSWSAPGDSEYERLFRRELGTITWFSSNPFCFGGCFDLWTIVPGQVYEYAVKACNTTWGCSDLSLETDTGYAGVMTAPTGVTASQGAFPDRVRLTWNPVTGATGYEITAMPYGGVSPTIVWVTGTTWDDMTALPVSSLWEYWVDACTSPGSCSSSTTSVWGWMETPIFVDGFETGDLLEWSSFR